MLKTFKGRKCISLKKSIVSDSSYCELFNIIRHVYIFNIFKKEVKNFAKS